MTGVEGMTTRLEAAQSALMDALDGITEVELHTPPSEGEWTVAEICAHVIEMQPLWAEKAASIGTASEVARTAAEADRRTAEIELHASDDAGTVRERLAAAGAEALGILQDMGDAGLDASDATGSLTGRGVIERYIIGHLAEHAAQIEQVRAALEPDILPTKREAPPERGLSVGGATRYRSMRRMCLSWWMLT